jgi:hypothetical protein
MWIELRPFCNCLHHVQIVCLSCNTTGTTHFTGGASNWSRGSLGAHHAEIDFTEQLITDHDLSFADRAGLRDRYDHLALRGIS